MTSGISRLSVRRPAVIFGDATKRRADAVRLFFDHFVLDDGRPLLWVEEVVDAEIRCRVVVGGELSNNKGINRLGGGLSAQAITDKDRADIRIAAEMGADYVAVSFPRSADDIHLARQLLQEAGGHGGIVAKIERAEALDALELDGVEVAGRAGRSSEDRPGGPGPAAEGLRRLVQ